ncbi:MAG: hypothetical protein ACD_78C00388G0007 [uncultured bacterium (gcode 4)]|uniref:Uncharacterized protein n=1 Tax=uncultured bacterium (gcode 4) TaxID=1234023 RepID=K1XW54_9BACT|nr:MAG: hypothetical protein ACD_78C00388G0007 [uncultured bacterium (gcode 4)]
MTFITKIQRQFHGIFRYWKNRRFRDEVRREKKQKYLFDTTKKGATFSLFSHNKKRFYYFNTLISIFEQNKVQFRLSFVLMGTFLCVSSIYIFFFSPYFRISPSKVIIERIDAVTDINIAYKSIEGVYGESIFSVDKNEVRTQMANLQKNLKRIDISRLFPNGLKIIIESYAPQFFVHFPDVEKNYIITSNGILIYQKTRDLPLYDLDLIDTRLSEVGFIEYKEAIREDFMRIVLISRDLFKQTFPTANIAKFAYFQAERELHIALESGTIILMRMWDDIEQQIAMLKYYNDSNKDIINSGNIQYIDVRTIGKVFSCAEKNLCKKNLARIYGPYYK